MSATAKRVRRTAAQISALEASIFEIVRDNKPCTVRSVFYMVTSRGLVDKSEGGYRTVQQRLMEMRTSNEMPWHWLSDNTRWRYGSKTYGSAKDAVEMVADSFYLDLSAYQKTRLEVWCEKDAITGALMPVTEKYRINLMPCRGFPSFTFLMGASDDASRDGRPFKIIYLGDHDPSGSIIDVKISEHMERYYTGAFQGVERLAVKPSQIKQFGLQTRPTKLSDSRSKNFDGESVEVDAIPPVQLRKLLEDAIVKEIDPRVYEMALSVEREERQTIKAFADSIANN